MCCDILLRLRLSVCVVHSIRPIPIPLSDSVRRRRSLFSCHILTPNQRTSDTPSAFDILQSRPYSYFLSTSRSRSSLFVTRLLSLTQTLLSTIAFPLFHLSLFNFYSNKKLSFLNSFLPLSPCFKAFSVGPARLPFGVSHCE